MKEITRRLYTKPFMLSMAVLVGIALVGALFVTSKSKAASTFIPAGDDMFETTNNGETYHNFSASPVPANFFGPGSQAYSGLVPLEGVPLAAGSDVDTIIHRNQGVVTPGTTSITMTGLSLKSINSIVVSYTGGGQEDWNVRVGLSDFKASTGSMTIHSGGTFDSSLKVWPKFTFTRVSDGLTKVLDTGSGSGLTGATASDDIAIEPNPNPEPTIAPAPCPVTEIDEFEGQIKISNGATLDATASRSCAPVTLTSTNSPWALCPGFCIPFPITEQELLASHFASPPGTKKRLATRTLGTAE